MADKPSVLVIDDEQGIRDLVQFVFMDKGYNIKTAHDGQNGVDTFFSGDFDIVLVDIHMPVKNGIEVIEEIKTQRPEQVIILFSSYSDRDFVMENKAKDFGVADCIFKPFDMHRLVNSVESAWADIIKQRES